MKRFLQLLTLVALGISLPAKADMVAVNGVDHNGRVGVYEINGEFYWWMGVEPNGSLPAGLGESYIADSLTFAEGWTQQNTERFVYYNITNPGSLAAVPKQVAIMEYVLDAYLPWDTLAGASGRFIEQDFSAANYGNDDPFYNALSAVQNFLSEMYGKPDEVNFATDLSLTFADFHQGDVTAAGVARSALFQSILDDVEAKDSANFFDSYTALNGYFMINTSYPEGDPNNWQDALVISFAAVPEPSGALLIGCFGIAAVLRRCRRARQPRAA
jgi:hypothetical protein